MSAKEPHASQSSGNARVALGLIVMTLGVMLLVDSIDSWWNFEFSVHIWPFVLIMLGLARAADPGLDSRGRLRRRRMGVWLLFLGFWGLVSAYRIFGLDYGNSWPLLVIGAGVMIVWRAMDPEERAPVVSEERHV